MSIIQDKISAIAPEAIFTQGQYPTFTVPAEKLREVALELRNDSDLLFDYMVSLTGVDEGPEIGLGVVYHLTSSVHNHWVVVKTSPRTAKIRNCLPYATYGERPN